MSSGPGRFDTNRNTAAFVLQADSPWTKGEGKVDIFLLVLRALGPDLFGLAASTTHCYWYIFFIRTEGTFETIFFSPHLVTRDRVLCCHELQLFFGMGKDLSRGGRK